MPRSPVLNPGQTETQCVPSAGRTALARRSHRGHTVVGDDGGQREGAARGHGSLIALEQPDLGRPVHDVRGAAAAPVHRDDLVIDDLFRHEPPDRRVGAAMGGNRPHELFVSPVRRHSHAPDKTLPPRVEIGRLSLIGIARLEEVVWPDRDVELLFVVPVQIAEDHVEAAIGVLLPALEHRLQVLSAVIGLSNRNGHARDDERARDGNEDGRAMVVHLIHGRSPLRRTPW